LGSSMSKISTYPYGYYLNMDQFNYDPYSTYSYSPYGYTPSYYFYPYNIAQNQEIKENTNYSLNTQMKTFSNVSYDDDKGPGRFSPEIVKILMETFSKTHKPTKEKVKDIAIKTGLTDKQVSAWFGRERRKIKESMPQVKEEKDPVLEKLTALKNEKGGITIDKIYDFNELIQISNDIKKRKRILNTLIKTEKSVLLELSEKFDSLTIINSWLIKATEGKIVAGYIKHILKVLRKFPISWDILRKSCIGITVGKLSKRKDIDLDIVEFSKELVKGWKLDLKKKSGIGKDKDTNNEGESKKKIKEK